MKLPRPYVPLAVRLEVAERQAAQTFPPLFFTHLAVVVAPRLRLAALLGALFGEVPYHLHHRPALVNRRLSWRRGRPVYDPPANDPAHLVYLAKGAHDIETRVRGLGAARSDLGQARYLRRLAANRKKRKKPSRWSKGRKLGGRKLVARHSSKTGPAAFRRAANPPRVPPSSRE